MDGANWRPTQGADPAAASAGVNPNAAAPAGGDWRAQLHPEARSRIVNKIMETLKKHLPVLVPEGLNELQKVAMRFEEKIYTSATSQSDYLRKISLKLLSMEAPNPQGPQPPPGNAQVIPNQNPAGPEPVVTDWEGSEMEALIQRLGGLASQGAPGWTPWRSASPWPVRRAPRISGCPCQASDM